MPAPIAPGCTRCARGSAIVRMHVRLRCPAGSLECQEQDTPPPGDGCGAELASWFVPHQPNAKPGKSVPPPLPPTCQALLDHHFSAE